jgi:trehalose-6-phosphate synthase
MRNLIVVSNRLPFVVNIDEKGMPVRCNSAGGLVTALTPLVANSNGFWIGWAGKDLTEDMEIPEASEENSHSQQIKRSQIVPIFYSDEIYNMFYNGMCNASLWPLMHSLPTFSVFRVDYWNAYLEVNAMFANAALETLRKSNEAKEMNGHEENELNTNNLVWIHDYHLLMMPLMLKNMIDEAGVACKIAFFLHIPFPSWDIFRLNPWSNELLLGLLGCDLIAFHTNSYAMNFLECCYHILGSRIDKHELLVEYGNKTTVVRALPIGIPYDWFEQMAKESPKPFSCKEKVILGVDRLDYTKGIILKDDLKQYKFDLYFDSSSQ